MKEKFIDHKFNTASLELIKTPEEIQTLKDSWVKDPCWDIEKSEDFEEHEEELFQFRMQMEALWQEKDVARLKARKEKIASETGVNDPLLADALFTFVEIENIVERSLKSESPRHDTDVAQVRATLLLAAQVKRIADLFEEVIDRQELNENTDFMTNLYKVD